MEVEMNFHYKKSCYIRILHMNNPSRANVLFAVFSDLHPFLSFPHFDYHSLGGVTFGGCGAAHEDNLVGLTFQILLACVIQHHALAARRGGAAHGSMLRDRLGSAVVEVDR